MATITYFAVDRGDLVSGHSELTEYTIEVDLSAFDIRTRRKEKTKTSLSGVRNTILHRIDKTYQAKTIPINDTAIIESMREFLSSVAGGEAFTLDPLGTIASADNPQTFVLNRDYSEKLVDVTGFYTFSFGVHKV